MALQYVKLAPPEGTLTEEQILSCPPPNVPEQPSRGFRSTSRVRTATADSGLMSASTVQPGAQPMTAELAFGADETNAQIDEEFEAVMARMGARGGKAAAVKSGADNVVERLPVEFTSPTQTGADNVAESLPLDAAEGLPHASPALEAPRRSRRTLTRLTEAQPEMPAAHLYGDPSKRFRSAVGKVITTRRFAPAPHGHEFSAAAAVGELEASLAEEEEFESVMARLGRRGRAATVCNPHAMDSVVDKLSPADAEDSSPAAPWDPRKPWEPPPEVKIESVCKSYTQHSVVTTECTTSNWGPQQVRPEAEFLGAVWEFKSCVGRLLEEASDANSSEATVASAKSRLRSLLGSAANTTRLLGVDDSIASPIASRWARSHSPQVTS